MAKYGSARFQTNSRDSIRLTSSLRLSRYPFVGSIGERILYSICIFHMKTIARRRYLRFLYSACEKILRLNRLIRRTSLVWCMNRVKLDSGGRNDLRITLTCSGSGTSKASKAIRLAPYSCSVQVFSDKTRQQADPVIESAYHDVPCTTPGSICNPRTATFGIFTCATYTLEYIVNTSRRWYKQKGGIQREERNM